MKIFLTKTFVAILNLSILTCFALFNQSCIDECDTNNSTIAILKIDSAGSDFGISAAVVVDNFVYDSLIQLKKKSSTFLIPLNLTQDFTTVSIIRRDSLKNDTASYSFKLNYKTTEYNKGPGCGMDIKITDLQISDTIVVTKSTKIRRITLPNTELSLQNTPNVKITF